MTKGAISLRVDKIKSVLEPDKIAKAAYPVFVDNTPIKTGNARRNTKVNVGPNRGEIAANYPYATRLDEGYSRQRPHGMTKPTLKWISEYIRRNLGK